MPYRRLPNTDKARARAMDIALKNQEEEVELVIPYDFRRHLEEVSRNFSNKLNFKNSTQEKGVLNNKQHTENTNRARMYLSHFLQVVNMSIQRGELSSEVRTFYGIDRGNQKLPDLSNEESLLKWGEKIIQGENERMNQRGNRIYNPSLALVSINYEKFVASYKDNKNQQMVQERANQELANYREAADKCILELWNILEEHFRKHNEKMFRTICSAWGISYVYRKGELEKLERQRYLDSISPSLDF